MKSKFTIAALLIIALVGGFFAGRYWTEKSWNAFFENYIYLSASVEAQQTTRVLTYLREGREQEGMNLLEMYLDSALLNYTPLVLIPQPEAPPTNVLRAIRVAREYRVQHPWTSEFQSSEVSNTLQQVMALPK